VSGGAELVGRLNELEQFVHPTRYTDDAATLHAALSAWLLAPSSRERVADPGLWPVNIEPIVNKDTARTRWACYDPDHALRPTDFKGDTLACARMKATAAPATGAPRTPDSPCGDEHATEVSACHASGTTAFAVADADGNVVAVTQTLGTWGGNFYVTPGLGFLSNDKLTSYGTDPTRYGARLPFARNGSTLAPTIVFRGNRPVFAVSAAGNAWITSAIYETLLGAMDYGLGPQQALELPRFLPGGRGGNGDTDSKFSIQLEDGFAPEVTRRLRALGYDLSFVSLRGELREGYGAAVAIDGKSVTAGADPRRSGAAGAVP
jgi:gamma-glutamyltranspeptidase